MTTVLFTGGSGRMASAIRPRLLGAFEVVTLFDQRPPAEVHAGETVVVGDLGDLQALTEAASGADVVLHFAGVADEAPFETVLQANVVGTYHVLEAARRAQVRRVVLASSHHAIGCYPTGGASLLSAAAPARPDTFYGASKVYGEALGRLYHDKWGLECVCLRIGAFRTHPEDARHLSVWLSHRDGAELVKRAALAPGVGYTVVWGISANQRAWWDTATSADIGYVPQDEAEAYASSVLGDYPDGAPQGGRFAAPDYQGGLW